MNHIYAMELFHTELEIPITEESFAEWNFGEHMREICRLADRIEKVKNSNSEEWILARANLGSKIFNLLTLGAENYRTEFDAVSETPDESMSCFREDKFAEDAHERFLDVSDMAKRMRA